MVGETTEARQAQVQRIAESKVFRSSEVQRNLLQYLAAKALAGEGDSVKEYTIGLDVFGKPESFDPRQESSVRMHAQRLRQKLAEYYRTEGPADSIIVDLPKGGFRLTFENRGDAPATADPPLDVAPPPNRKWLIPLVGVAFVAVLGLMLFVFRGGAPAVSTEPPADMPAMSAELAELWAPFFNSPRPILVCLAVPKDSAKGTGTANGAFFLGQFLTPNRKREVLLTRSDQISMPEIAMDNVVFVGSMAGSRPVESIPMAAQLRLEDKGVRVLEARKGEPDFYADHSGQTGEGVPDETYALVSHMPGLYGNGQVLLLEGNHTSSVMAAVRSFTDPKLGADLVAALKRGGGMPRFYQVLLRVRSMDEMPVEVSYITHREIAAK